MISVRVGRGSEGCFKVVKGVLKWSEGGLKGCYEVDKGGLDGGQREGKVGQRWNAITGVYNILKASIRPLGKTSRPLSCLTMVGSPRECARGVG